MEDWYMKKMVSSLFWKLCLDSECHFHHEEHLSIYKLEEKIIEALRQARKDALSEASDIAECRIYKTDDCNEICRMIATAIRTAGALGEREI